MDAPTTEARRVGGWSALSQPVFMALWATQAVTQTAQNVVNFALLVLAQTLTGSSAQVGFIILSFSLPAVLFGAVAGVLVDRWDKRLVLVASNVVRGAAVASYIFATDAGDMPQIYLASFIFATAAQFFAPAQGAVIPRLVGKDQLIAANSLYNLTFMAAQFLGFTLVGWLLIRLLGIRDVFILVCVLYLIAAAVTVLLPIPAMKNEGGGGRSTARVWAELWEGWRFIASRRALLVTILHLSIVNSIYLMLGTIGPAFVSRVLQIRAEDLGVLLAPAGVSTLLGVLAVSRLARRENRHQMIHAGLLGVGLSILGLALLEPVARLVGQTTGLPVPLTAVTVIAVLLSTPFGFSAAFIAIPAQTVLQENSPDEIRGRVLATFFTVSNAAAFFPIILAGAVADWLGILQTLGLVGLFIATVGALSHRQYVRSGYTWNRKDARQPVEVASDSRE